MKEQHDGRKDQPVTGADLYNVAVQLDSNFASLRSESLNLRVEMVSEFKSVRSEMASEFKAVRAEMSEGFSELRSEMSRIPLKTAAWVATTMIGLVGVICAVVTVVVVIV